MDNMKTELCARQCFPQYQTKWGWDCRVRRTLPTILQPRQTSKPDSIMGCISEWRKGWEFRKTSEDITALGSRLSLVMAQPRVKWIISCVTHTTRITHEGWWLWLHAIFLLFFGRAQLQSAHVQPENLWLKLDPLPALSGLGLLAILGQRLANLER